MTINEFLIKNCLNKIDSNFLEEKNISINEVVGIPLYSYLFFKQRNDNLLVICQSLYVAEQIRDETISLIGEENVIYIPSEELVMVEYTASSSDILTDRVFGLYKLLNCSHKIIIANSSTVSRYFPEKKLFESYVFDLTVGQEIGVSNLKEKLLSSGYTLVNKVSKTGECAFRGEIIDIFSCNNDYPIRIDLFDNEIESIHKFNISSQESFASIQSTTIIPFSDQLYDKADLINASEKIFNQAIKDLEVDSKPELESNCDADINEICSNNKNSKFYKYFSFISTKTATLFDYFDCNNTLFSNYNDFTDGFNKLLNDERNFLYNLCSEGKNITHLSLYNEYFLSSFKGRTINNNLIENENSIPLRQPVFFNTNPQLIKASLSNLLEDDYKILLVFANEQQKEFFFSQYIDVSLFPAELEVKFLNNLSFCIDNFSYGMDFYKEKAIILTQRELFGYRFGSARYISKFKESTILKSYDELSVGDYVVHENYGIGIYAGVKQIETDGKIMDFLQINYAGDDVLYVPLEQFTLVRKYVSKEGYVPKLSKLFNDKWENTKKKIKERVNLLADKLFELYKSRISIPGIEYGKDDELQRNFENDFEFELTQDQEEALEDVKKDMESPSPMDRLICGDVGFGKTEIAFRAAFKAIENGKQVLFLCPTTLLARQHYERALLRFTKYDVKISFLSRFLTTSQFNSDVKNIADGKIHLIIGTHKALSKKVIFKDLGLLIIDEEQRFGVEQKEKIKMKYPNIDTLSLSATPIPRTLQISLIGMKSLSVINTPPRNRAPIQTYLIEQNDKIIFDVIKRELGRGGQVYYVHNDILDINTPVDKLRKNIPNAVVGFIHGKMDKALIDETMDNFYNGTIQILVATTIIENGIDVPNANLIIIENADRFGLAQLYQIKGRVGRSNKLAYAYLTYRKNKQLDDVALKRLKAIKEFTELGSGYKIAQRDLMIRGAGDILGPEQAGFIDDVGIDLYLKLLSEAIKEKSGKEAKEPNKIEFRKILSDGYIPNSYANDDDKFEIYQLINDSKSIEELKESEKKIEDIYGKIPVEIEGILKIKKLKLRLENELIADYDETRTLVSVRFSSKFTQIEGIGSEFFAKLFMYKDRIRLSFTDGLIKVTLKKTDKWIDELIHIIDIAILLYNKKYEIR